MITQIVYKLYNKIQGTEKIRRSWIWLYIMDPTSNFSGRMIEANEIDVQSDEKIDFEPSANVNLSNTSKIEITNSSNMSLTSSTTATILQAYAARLNSDSDYAR